MYFKASKIDVFPVSVERPSKPEAQLLTEDHVSNIVRSIVDFPSYVITEDYDGTELEFILYGYYVKLKLDEGFSFSSVGNSDIYALLYLNTASPDNPILWGADSGLPEDKTPPEYRGITFTTKSSFDSKGNFIGDAPPLLGDEKVTLFEAHELKILESASGSGTGGDGTVNDDRGDGHHRVPSDSKIKFKCGLIVDGGEWP